MIFRFALNYHAMFAESENLYASRHFVLQDGARGSYIAKGFHVNIIIHFCSQTKFVAIMFVLLVFPDHCNFLSIFISLADFWNVFFP